ncbi:hypothetical protein MJO28_010413 [Puccinia striiformis f. sp. tritici]|uniref:Uncharacterized protein n=1 Tax=Puccinia striiformis f. sp. tritici TaxID=168172 RepID=A0ACC0E6E2_9BASI|nr:hypothetical protein MJO29_016541 [Puccinia striiformis f. sp. tritici]KAI9617221.1 hypothetical protein H4Q26_013086 [Puccinia striiformis f. sp. tritici PST-130]KAI7936159.1 hypothetical protein MJO29_015462 [Puccinia striiformis f. sp. tritici]KAI7944718.1 hypothetical protein MJO28_010413 [Puccinia striiformis f. sp. tritici]KAI7946926.1 hypothetical protein MJO29_011453 [Puccinia striiformis f. sp. tritici]
MTKGIKRARTAKNDSQRGQSDEKMLLAQAQSFNRTAGTKGGKAAAYAARTSTRTESSSIELTALTDKENADVASRKQEREITTEIRKQEREITTKIRDTSEKL